MRERISRMLKVERGRLVRTDRASRPISIHGCCAVLLLLAVSFSTYAATIRDDDSCDIATLPAATLLLPYFEVDFNSPPSVARTTIFSIINTSRAPEIARVTLWTDWAFPALSFNIFLTGYDTQSINLYDILGPRGAITLQERSVGSISLPNDANPNFLTNAASACERLPGTIPANILTDLRSALTTGIYSSCGSAHVGGIHTNAIGYVTIDTVATCGVTLPNEAAYFNELLYDNVLSGDWQIIDPNPATGNYAGGDPLVHIRAMPAGGPPGVVTQTNLPYTFYDHYTPHQDRDTARMDRRQPLPSTFSARFIQGGVGAFDTNFRIWREGVSASSAVCRDYASNNGSAMRVRDEVRFDEHENPTILSGGIIILLPTVYIVLPSASSTATSSALYPLLSTASGDVSGWMYLNLTNERSNSRPSQNWVITSMSAEGRYMTDFTATPLGNGCSPARQVSDRFSPGYPIAPPPNVTP